MDDLTSSAAAIAAAAAAAASGSIPSCSIFFSLMSCGEGWVGGLVGGWVGERRTRRFE